MCVSVSEVDVCNVCTDMCVGTYTHTHMQGPEKGRGILYHCLPYSLETGFLTELGAGLATSPSNPPVSVSQEH